MYNDELSPSPCFLLSLCVYKRMVYAQRRRSRLASVRSPVCPFARSVRRRQRRKEKCPGTLFFFLRFHVIVASVGETSKSFVFYCCLPTMITTTETTTTTTRTTTKTKVSRDTFLSPSLCIIVPSVGDAIFMKNTLYTLYTLHTPYTLSPVRPSSSEQ